MTLTVNGREAEPGCYVDGHWGQYGGDHLADKLEDFGIVIARNDDPRRFRRIADWCDEMRYVADDGPLANVHRTAYEAQYECADELIDQANQVTDGGYWEWWEGEVYLRSYVCSECGRDARDPGGAAEARAFLTRCGIVTQDDDDPYVKAEASRLGWPFEDRAACDYCCDADDPGVYA